MAPEEPERGSNELQDAKIYENHWKIIENPSKLHHHHTTGGGGGTITASPVKTIQNQRKISENQPSPHHKGGRADHPQGGGGPRGPPP